VRDGLILAFQAWFRHLTLLPDDDAPGSTAL